MIGVFVSVVFGNLPGGPGGLVAQVVKNVTKTSSHSRATEKSFPGKSTLVVRGELQSHPVKTNINIRMVIDLLRFLSPPR